MLTIDLRPFERAARDMGALADQTPFALATALNKSADVARDELPQVWAQHIHARNPSFLRSALTTKGAKANKRSLRVELYDQWGRGNLKLHDEGGVATGRGAFAIATATSGIAARRGPKGVPKGLRPRNLPNSFAKPGKGGDKVIYQRTGKYQKATKSAQKKAAKAGAPRPKGVDNRHLKLEYVTHPSNRVRPDVPFHQAFGRIMKREMPHQFDVAMRSAMKTAFRR